MKQLTIMRIVLYIYKEFERRGERGLKEVSKKNLIEALSDPCLKMLK